MLKVFLERYKDVILIAIINRKTIANTFYGITKKEDRKDLEFVANWLAQL